MNYTVKALPKSLKEIRVEVSADEIKPLLEKSAAEISSKAKIEGFRPGKASYDVVVRKFGEMAILEEALPAIVQKYFVEIVKKDSLETVGEPRINVEKVAPGNEVIFTVTVAMMPRTTKLADYHKISVKAKDVKIEDKEVEKVVDELRKMQATELDVDREARKGDKVVVDLEMLLDKVVVEGGTAKDHGIYLDEPYYVPGLNEQLYGMNKDEKKSFVLKFPKDHFNKMLSGNDVTFNVTMKKVQEITHPEANEEFAKKLGQASMDTLRGLLRKNLEEEGALKEKQRQEIAVLEELVSGSKFDDLPEILVNAEIQKMMHELEHSIERNNVPFADYLSQIKKTRDQLMLDFTPEAMKRVKSSILMREIGKKENLETTDAEMLEEQMKLINTYKDDAETQERVRSDDGETYIRTTLRNRKVVEFLRKLAVK
jgi:trigger factor